MLIADLQRSIARHLRADSYFAGTPPIPVVARCDPKSFQIVGESLQAAQITVVLWPSKGRFIRPNTPRPAVDIEFTLRVCENAVLSTRQEGAGLCAEDVAWAAARLLHLWIPADTNGKQLTGSSFVLGEVKSEEISWRNFDLYSCEFTASISASDTEQTARSVRT